MLRHEIDELPQHARTAFYALLAVERAAELECILRDSWRLVPYSRMHVVERAYRRAVRLARARVAYILDTNCYRTAHLT